MTKVFLFFFCNFAVYIFQNQDLTIQSIVSSQHLLKSSGTHKTKYNYNGCYFMLEINVRHFCTAKFFTFFSAKFENILPYIFEILKSH